MCDEVRVYDTNDFEEGEGEDEIDEVEAVLDTTDGDCGDEEALFVGER